MNEIKIDFSRKKTLEEEECIRRKNKSITSAVVTQQYPTD